MVKWRDGGLFPRKRRGPVPLLLSKKMDILIWFPSSSYVDWSSSELYFLLVMRLFHFPHWWWQNFPVNTFDDKAKCEFWGQDYDLWIPFKRRLLLPGEEFVDATWLPWKQQPINCIWCYLGTRRDRHSVWKTYSCRTNCKWNKMATVSFIISWGWQHLIRDDIRGLIAPTQV